MTLHDPTLLAAAAELLYPALALQCSCSPHASSQTFQLREHGSFLAQEPETQRPCSSASAFGAKKEKMEKEKNTKSFMSFMHDAAPDLKDQGGLQEWWDRDKRVLTSISDTRSSFRERESARVNESESVRETRIPMLIVPVP
jgi:hypothetical protein